MGITGFLRNDETPDVPAALEALLRNCSIEVMPRTVSKIEDFRQILPQGTRVYVAHINGTPIDDMIATARRLTDDGFHPMPHLPARVIPDRTALENWLSRYREQAGVTQALLLGGGVPTPAGGFESSIALLETGLFDKFGFRRLHVAGHPEGNRDIDVNGGSARADEALRWKQSFSERTDAEMAIVTQFAFDAAPVIAWAERIATEGISLPIHVGVAGPTKLQTLIKYAVACGVGPSLNVLQKRALDLRKLLLPYEPTDFLVDIAAHKAARLDSLIEQAHLFPLGGIRASAEWLARMQAETRSI
nr:methylenetetrahydrofolate reductase [Rhizobium sp. Q54]